MPTTESGVISDWCLVPPLRSDFWTERTSKQPLFCYPEAISFNKLCISRGQLLRWKHVIFHFLPATSMRHADLQSHTHAHFSRGWGKFAKYVQVKWPFCMILRLISLDFFFSEAAGVFFWKTKQNKNLEFIWAVIALTSLSSKATFSGINRVVEPKNRAGLHYSFLWGISWHCNACSIFYIFQPQKEFRLIKKPFLRGSPLCTYFCCFMKSPEPLWLCITVPRFSEGSSCLTTTAVEGSGSIWQMIRGDDLSLLMMGDPRQWAGTTCLSDGST